MSITTLCNKRLDHALHSVLKKHNTILIRLLGSASRDLFIIIIIIIIIKLSYVSRFQTQQRVLCEWIRALFGVLFDVFNITDDDTSDPKYIKIQKILLCL